MSKWDDRLRIMEESKRRIAAMEFGQPVTNVCAGDGNPHWHAYFVAGKTNARKNRFGVVHRDYLVRCTDKKGKFWDTGIEVVYPGHLSREECERIFAPIHAAYF